MPLTIQDKTNLLSYDEAWLYCACLFEDGYSDWRMPSYVERIQYIHHDLYIWDNDDYAAYAAHTDYKRWGTYPVRSKDAKESKIQIS